jgi:hypothetical protein
VEGREHSEDVGIDGRIILLMDLTEVGRKSVDWIRLAQDMSRLFAVVNWVMNIRFP